MKALTIAVALAVLTTGCATVGTRYVPVVDLKDKDPVKYESDLKECQTLSEQRGDTAGAAVAGAAFGAILGAILAPREFRNGMVNRGALMGAGSGAGQAVQTQQAIIKQCLTGRGYAVLN